MIATFFYIFFLLLFGYKQKFLKKNTASVRDSGFFGVNFGTAATTTKKKKKLF
jgi:hypothetical protein